MSRTDKTRPWNVKCLDDPSWLEERHDHSGADGSDGTCDLPPRPRKVGSAFGGGQQADTLRGVGERCSWAASTEFWIHRANGCGCPTCNDQDGRRAARRKSRHEAARLARAERDYATGADLSDSLDDPVDLDDDTSPERDDLDALRLTYLREHDDLELGQETDTEERMHAVIGRWLELPAGSYVVGIRETFGGRVDPEDWGVPVVEVTVMDGTGARAAEQFAWALDVFLGKVVEQMREEYVGV